MTKPIEPTPAEPSDGEPTPADPTSAEYLLLGALMLASSGTAPPCLLERATIH